MLRGAHPTTLTPRQCEVLGLVNQGLSNQAIAAALHIAHWTVNEHLAEINRRLGAKTRTEACYLARQRGLLPGPAR
jgi:DNA-binding NarL/FixJ family response regulator